MKNEKRNMMTAVPKTEKATLGGGCFWCIEAVYGRIEGVVSAVSGYAGGSIKNPTYKEVCNGTTGHAEVVQIEFNPAVLAYEELLGVFWKAHDPTTLNRQGADIGTQYRSVIFYHNEKQRKTAERSKAEAAKDFASLIVTEIKPLDDFYKAEDHHQEYYDNNKAAPYCSFVIRPKLEKLNLR